MPRYAARRYVELAAELEKIPRARSASRPRPMTPVWIATARRSDRQLAGERDGLLLGEGGHRLDADPAVGGVDERHLGRGPLVGCVDDRHRVVSAHGEVEGLQRRTELGGSLAGVGEPVADGL